MEAFVHSHIEHGINTIEFFIQKQFPSRKIIGRLSQEIHFAGTHEETKVIILKSYGDKTFCAGASFDGDKLLKNEKEGLKFFSGLRM
jgi:methylglutaconyl-CoA hydratase